MSIAIPAPAASSEQPGDESKPITPRGIRARVRALVAELTKQYAQRGTVPTLAAGHEARSAALLGIEDAAVADRDNGRSATQARHDYRIGQFIAHDVDQIMSAAAAAGIARGEDPEREVTRAANLMWRYTALAAQEAIDEARKAVRS